MSWLTYVPHLDKVYQPTSATDDRSTICAAYISLRDIDIIRRRVPLSSTRCRGPLRNQGTGRVDRFAKYLFLLQKTGPCTLGPREGIELQPSFSSRADTYPRILHGPSERPSTSTAARATAEVQYHAPSDPSRSRCLPTWPTMPYDRSGLAITAGRSSICLRQPSPLSQLI